MNSPSQENRINPDPRVAADSPAPEAPTRWCPTAWQLVACVCWLGTCLVASYVAMRYDFQPGRLGPPRTGWPADAALAPSPDQVTVLAFLHPRCVCTAATVKQLTRTMRANPGAELVAVVFIPPEPEPAKDWEDGEYVRTIRAEVPGARIVPDRGGVEAQRFGASTSGTILVHDRQGKEVFRGGITDRRGGARDNPGLRQLARALSGEERNELASPTPVFGCPLDARTTAAAAPGNRGDAP